MDDQDAWHERVARWFAGQRHPAIVPSPVVEETAYLVADRRGPRAEASLLRAIAAGEFVLEPVDVEDLARAADLIDRYADLPLGFVDASIVAIAERLDITTILTTDRRHFGVVRPAHVPRLTLAP